MMDLRSFNFFLIFVASNYLRNVYTLSNIKRSHQKRDSLQDYWVQWPNASKLYSDQTCSRELAPYPAIPEIIAIATEVYDAKNLSTFTNLGDSFLKVITRNSLYDTVKLVTELSPIDSTEKILQLVEFQLIMFIVLVIGTVTATAITVVFVLFCILKLTGRIKEVQSQEVSDSNGPMRYILSFLLSIFAIMILFGCVLSWVANTHISNNTNEVSQLVEWSVDTTKDYSLSVQEQMKTLFGTQYEDIHLEILKTRLDEAVYNAAGLVYLEIAANVSETYKKSTNLTNSITNHLKAEINSMNNLYKSMEGTLRPYLDELKETRACIVTIEEWCQQSANAGRCDEDKKIPESYLKSVDPDNLFYENVAAAAADAVNIVQNGKLDSSVLQAYHNGKYFHSGNLEVGDLPSFTKTCFNLDQTTGVLLFTTDPRTEENTISESVTCSDIGSCVLQSSLTEIHFGECCVNTQSLRDQVEEISGEEPDLTVCGPKEYRVANVLQVGGYQSHYEGNMETTLSGATCVPWADVVKVGAKSWEDWADEQGYSGLENNYCRNPSPADGVYGTVAADAKSRAWCFTDADGSWQYCNVTFCLEDARAALEGAGEEAAFHYPTCEYVAQQVLKGAASLSSENYTLWITTQAARDEAYETLVEAAREIRTQFNTMESKLEKANYALEELKNTILSNLAVGSNSHSSDEIRKMVTTVVTGLCLLSVCLGVGGVCVGFCNLTGTPPHLRSSGCSVGGRLINISAYLAATLAIVNLVFATVYFVPGSIFSLLCTDYKEDNLFQLLDEKVLVDYSILGRAVLGEDSYEGMTLKKFLLDCRGDETLWRALSLSQDPDYNLRDMMCLNETLEVNQTFARLLSPESIDFTNYPSFPENLRTWLQFWNSSDATQLNFTTIEENLNTPFMGASLESLTPGNSATKINNQYFCNAFHYYGAQVTDISTSEAFQCKSKFVNNYNSQSSLLKTQCNAWLSNYDSSVDDIGKLKAQAQRIVKEWTIYNPTFMDDLITKFDWTNKNLLNLEGSEDFSFKILNQTYLEYWQPLMNNEVNCLSWQMNRTMDRDLATCSTVSSVLDTTMDYFCDYLVTSLTIAWVSQGLLGFVLTLHMLVATKLATYFIKLEKQHPNDIPKEERLAAFQRA